MQRLDASGLRISRRDAPGKGVGAREPDNSIQPAGFRLRRGGNRDGRDDGVADRRAIAIVRAHGGRSGSLLAILDTVWMPSHDATVAVSPAVAHGHRRRRVSAPPSQQHLPARGPYVLACAFQVRDRHEGAKAEPSTLN